MISSSETKQKKTYTKKPKKQADEEIKEIKPPVSIAVEEKEKENIVLQATETKQEDAKPKTKKTKATKTTKKTEKTEESQAKTKTEEVKKAEEPTVTIKPSITLTPADPNKEVVSLIFTQIHGTCSIRKIFQECVFLKMGEIVKIVLSSCYPSQSDTTTTITNTGNKTSKAYVYIKPINMEFIELLGKAIKPVPAVFLDNDETWCIELNKEKKTNHFRTDQYEQKRLLIQSINSARSSDEIHYLFREHGEMEQADMAWVQSNDYPLPTRAQVYLYFRDWGEELFTYKLLEELNDVGVFTIKYDYNGNKDLLWVYELCPQDEFSTEYTFEYGKYPKWIPQDEPKYGNRKNKNNKLNWLFTKAGKFAYAEKIVEDELLKHGGLFIGPEKSFYKITDVTAEDP